MRASLWWLLPSDGEFQSAPDGHHYYLARQGRRVVLRGGDVRAPLPNSRVNWIYDPHPNQPPRVKPRQTVPKINNNTVPKNNHNTVPKNNNVVKNSKSHARSPLETIPSASWYNSNLPLPSASSPRKNVYTPVPRSNNQENSKTTQVRNDANSSSQPPKKKRDRKHRRERRARERENRGESFIHDAHWANQRSVVPGSPVVPARVTQSTSQAIDPISPMRTAVYPPSGFVGNPPTNDNSPFQIGRESSRNLGLYKPAAPDQNQDTWAYDLEANSSGIGPPSPTRTFAANSSGSGNRTGIVYPLQPRGRRPDVCIEVEASLPEPAALLRPDLPQPESPTQPQEAPANLQRAFRRLSRKRRRNRSTAVFRPAKRSPPRGHWCD